jgi:uroporphyrin-III C-methyltransferase/precorrin-2 dehydrogenase/sirohydrochlorin ferrochelatase
LPSHIPTDHDATALLPLFVKLRHRRVLLVGGGTVATAKLRQLLAIDADVVVVAPEIAAEIEAAGVEMRRRAFEADDLADVWFVVAAAPPAVNATVAAAADARRILVNAVDDPPHATAYFGGVLRRGGITLAISSDGAAPALTALLRQALDALLPRDTGRWMAAARRARAEWRRHGVPIEGRRPLLLETLNRLYQDRRA